MSSKSSKCVVIDEKALLKKLKSLLRTTLNSKDSGDVQEHFRKHLQNAIDKSLKWKSEMESKKIPPIGPALKKSKLVGKENAASGLALPPGILTTPEVIELAQNQLIMLLHAHSCQLRENYQKQSNGKQWECNQRSNCEYMRNKLRHLSNCHAGKDCQVPICKSSSSIINHCKNCKHDNICLICEPLKQAFIKCFNFKDAVASLSPSSGKRTLYDALTELTADYVKGTKEWQSTTPDPRKDILNTMIDAALPKGASEPLLDPRLHDLVSDARKAEAEAYEAANSRSEYYILLTKKISKIKNVHEESRRKCKEGTEVSKAAVTPTSG